MMRPVSLYVTIQLIDEGGITELGYLMDYRIPMSNGSNDLGNNHQRLLTCPKER